MLLICSIGYETLVFSVISVFEKSTIFELPWKPIFSSNAPCFIALNISGSFSSDKSMHFA